jgi:hypothetical protein
MSDRLASRNADFLSALNPQQRAATEHKAGPLLVVAGAGTGKTKTLAARVARLIQGGGDPSRILLLTFTRRAAAEMIRRAGQTVGTGVADRVWGGTFHAVAHRLLCIYGQSLGLGAAFTVMDQGDAEDLIACPHRPGPAPEQAPLSEAGHAAGHLLLLRQHRRPSGQGAGRSLPLVPLRSRGDQARL